MIDFLHKEIKPGDKAVRVKSVRYSSYFEIVEVLDTVGDKVKILAPDGLRASWVLQHKLVII